MVRKCDLLIGLSAIVTICAVSAPMGAHAQSSQPSKETVLAQQAPLSSQPSKEEVLGAMRAGAASGAQPQIINPFVPAMSLCFTCGGSWPAFSGAIPLPAGSLPTERGGGCSGNLIARPDTAPFLCSQQ
jgi:hypothetical protein